MNSPALHVRAGSAATALRPQPAPGRTLSSAATRPATAVLAILAARSRLRRLWRRVARARDIRDSVAALASLDDHLLRDIGIERQQIPMLARQLADGRRAALPPARPSSILSRTSAAADPTEPADPQLRRAA